MVRSLQILAGEELREKMSAAENVSCEHMREGGRGGEGYLP